MTDTSTGAAGQDTSATTPPAPAYADDPAGHLDWHAATDDGRSVGWTCEAADCPRSDVRGMPRGWAVLVRFLGPTNYRGSRWVATGDHPIRRAVVSYDYGQRQGIENARLAADALIAKWAADYAERYPDAPAWPHRIVAGGHLPGGDYAFIVA